MSGVLSGVFQVLTVLETPAPATLVVTAEFPLPWEGGGKE